MSEQKPEAGKRRDVTTIAGNRAGNTHADAVRAKLAQQGVQPADVADAVNWVRQPADAQHDQCDDTTDRPDSIKP